MPKPFDWTTFLERQRIDYRDAGPNVGRDHIVTQCPFCGHQDASMHMSIHLHGNGWRCWRNHEHAGINPTRLVQALLKTDWHTAAGLTGHSGPQPQIVYRPETWLDKVHKLINPDDNTPKPPAPMVLPESARLLTVALPVAQPYQSYLRRRGFSDMQRVSLGFDVHFDARSHRWHGRILFPVKTNGQIVAMTGRAISDRATPRYLADGAVDRTLIWADRFPTHGCTLVLTEGPFDALKVNYLGNQRGIYATCAMTSAFSPTQRAHLYELLPRFQRTVVCFDRGNEASAYHLASNFAGRIETVALPDYASDPAELHDLDWLGYCEDDRGED